MSKFKDPICSLLLVSIFITSCNGQTTSKQTNEPVAEQLSFTGKNTKLTKTQGTTEHQNIHCSLQDKNGNIWFGTDDGVSNYDGKTISKIP
jgi:ligand-binding sensor domain-containing protein